MQISRELFEAYEAVRESGITNMFDVNMVIKLANKIMGTHITREEIVEIMHNYTELRKKYLND
jgi:hypothetical protein